MKKLLVTGLLLSVLLIGGCGGAPVTTTTETITVTVTTTAVSTAATDARTLRDFLDAARQRYAEGLTCGDTVYTPELGISEADFYGLEVNSDLILLFSGLPYFYVAVPHALNGLKDSVTVDQYKVVFDDPDPEAIRLGGGYATRTRAYQGDTLLGETVFHGATSVENGDYLTAVLQNVGPVMVLAIGYRPDCNVPVRAVTLVLAPIPPPG